jgi:ribosomal protein S2
MDPGYSGHFGHPQNKMDPMAKYVFEHQQCHQFDLKKLKNRLKRRAAFC